MDTCLLPVHTHAGFIALPNWKTGLMAPQCDTTSSHIVLILSKPVSQSGLTLGCLFVVALCNSNSFVLHHGSDLKYEMRRRKPKPTFY